MTRWRAFRPAMARPALRDSLHSGLGVGLGLGLATLVVHLAEDRNLIAPLGASAVMVFALPNSPLAQPWSVVAGNVMATLIAVLMISILPATPWNGPLVVTTALLAMQAIRALHPPGGAMAFLVALGDGGSPVMVLAVAALGSVVLVLAAMIWHGLTGRVYPFRQALPPGPKATTNLSLPAGSGPDPADLARILEEYRQSANLGVADLARLVGAAEQATAARRLKDFTAADIMARDLATVTPDAPISQVADIFRSRGATALPVVGPEGVLGLIFQIDLIRSPFQDYSRKEGRIMSTVQHILGTPRLPPPRAANIMQTGIPVVTADTPAGALVSLMADRGMEAVPVVDGQAILGIVTRTDLMSALARRLAPPMA